MKKTITEIKDEVAKANGYDDWQYCLSMAVLYDSDDYKRIIKIIDEAIKSFAEQYGKECFEAGRKVHIMNDRVAQIRNKYEVYTDYEHFNKENPI